MRFAPTDSVAYNASSPSRISSLTPDYGNTVPNTKPGAISLTGNGKIAISGTPATATWPMFSGTTIVLDAMTDGAISATSATLTGLVNKNVNYNARAVRHARRHVAGRGRAQRRAATSSSRFR